MSGGSYDYAYTRIEDLADMIRERCGEKPNRALRLAFAKHLNQVADAAHAIEWTDSGDNAEGSEDAAIRACLCKDAELDAAILIATSARRALDAAILRAEELAQ